MFKIPTRLHKTFLVFSTRTRQKQNLFGQITVCQENLKWHQHTNQTPTLVVRQMSLAALAVILPLSLKEALRRH